MLLLLLPALFVLHWTWSFRRLSWWHWFLLLPEILESCRVCLGFSGIGLVTCCITVSICSSSGAFKPLNSNSSSRCDTICAYVRFSKCACLFDFFRCGGILANINCSMIARAATPKASWAITFFKETRKGKISRFNGVT